MFSPSNCFVVFVTVGPTQQEGFPRCRSTFAVQQRSPPPGSVAFFPTFGKRFVSRRCRCLFVTHVRGVLLCVLLPVQAAWMLFPLIKLQYWHMLLASMRSSFWCARHPHFACFLLVLFVGSSSVSGCPVRGLGPQAHLQLPCQSAP